jgi:hypothetical protein
VHKIKVIPFGDNLKKLFLCTSGCTIRKGRITEHYPIASTRKTFTENLVDSYSTSDLIECSNCEENSAHIAFFGEIDVMSRNIKVYDIHCSNCLKESRKFAEYPWNNVIKHGNKQKAFNLKTDINFILKKSLQ